MLPDMKEIKATDFKRARAAAKLTQQQAADLLGVDLTTYQRWEYGKGQSRKGLHLEKLRAARRVA